jgi:hypothetical protein
MSGVGSASRGAAVNRVYDRCVDRFANRSASAFPIRSEALGCRVRPLGTSVTPGEWMAVYQVTGSTRRQGGTIATMTCRTNENARGHVHQLAAVCSMSGGSFGALALWVRPVGIRTVLQWPRRKDFERGLHRFDQRLPLGRTDHIAARHQFLRGTNPNWGRQTAQARQRVMSGPLLDTLWHPYAAGGAGGTGSPDDAAFCVMMLTECCE